ncbi:MAG: hypothetical protein E3J60_00630 [Dehalococcoidia bacterium]|nr:MAG: hypothetical protein E3J60_00630 [Dehalococcoidia bacterium]
MLSDEDVNRIAEAVVEKAAEDVGVRDIMIGSVMGKGAIPLYGRETRKEPCACCLIDPEGPNAPENRMCTTKGAIGTLNNREERNWCSEITIVPDGRCTRARSIREAARECKEKHPDDTAKFFECYAPAFSRITKGGNPGEEYVTVICPICTREITITEYNSVTRSEALIKHLEKEHPVRDQSEYVTITDPGKTTFKVGEIISRKAFEKENERVKKLSEKPAIGR